MGTASDSTTKGEASDLIGKHQGADESEIGWAKQNGAKLRKKPRQYEVRLAIGELLASEQKRRFRHHWFTVAEISTAAVVFCAMFAAVFIYMREYR